MKNLFAMTFVGVAVLMPVAAGAGERVTDMALGAASGALVAGPVGLVAGGVIGFAAGPDISRGMGLRRHHRTASHSAANHAAASHTAADRDNSKAGEAQPDGH